ncbi:MAG: glycolate oxidase subunit GlcF [Chloroflexota bacterium]|nr:glycolate oxidase subunit GlcF [Chloroflexota bacterium]
MAETTARPLSLYVAGDAPARELIQRCVHCGFCLPTCPTYAVLGVEADSPRGRIRLMKDVWEGRIAPQNAAFERHVYQCLDCRACETACPSGVEYGKLVEAARSQVERTRPRGAVPRLVRWLAFDQLLPHPRRLALVARLTYLARDLGAAALLRLIGRRIRLAERLAGSLDLVPSGAPSAPQLPLVFPASGERRARVALFQGCIQRAAFGGTNAATARVLARNGIEVIVPEEQTCCGALHVHAGERASGRELAKRNIAAFERLGVDAIVINAAGCGANVKEYGWLLKDDPLWAERAARFAATVKDATEILGDMGLTSTPGRLEASVAYDEPCHLLHGQKISAQPKALLAQVPGLRIVPLAEADWCCGGAGIYNVTQPDLSQRLLHRKMEHVRAAAPDILVTANPGCLMQLASGVRASGMRTEVLHLIDVLDRAYAAAS